VEPLNVLRGRFVNARDVAEERKVAVVGALARDVLFGATDPIGRYLTVQGVHFQVVGEVTSDKGGDDGERVKGTVFVPFSTFQSAFNQRDRVHWFALTAKPDVGPEVVESRVKSLLRVRHGVSPADTNALGSFNAAEKVEQIEALFRGVRVFVWFVGVLTLGAGMLGVSNILLITVKERTREIGIRKALGATPWAITSMVLREALALTTLSGYAGLVCGVAVLELVGRAVSGLPEAPLSQPEVNVGAALVAAALLVAAGLAAGYVPARHANRISPVEALRAE
jgi:putative ABC transport system permease protein